MDPSREEAGNILEPRKAPVRSEFDTSVPEEVHTRLRELMEELG